MAWKNKMLPLVAAALGLILGLWLTVAQAQEAYWRVTNGATGKPAPLYAGSASPFPIRKKPVKQEELSDISAIERTRNDAETTRRQQRAVMAASLLSEIRQILRDDKAFQEDTTGLQVGGISIGDGVKLALIKGDWMTIGDKITVPIRAAEKVLSLVDQLAMVDDHLAEIVRGEVQSRLSGTGPAKLKITEIKSNGVVLVSQHKHRTVISFEPSDF